MSQLVVLSSDNELNSKVRDLCGQASNPFSPRFFDSGPRVLEVLKYDLPELTLLNCADDRILSDEVLQTIRLDPWLHYGGIIAVHDEDDEDELRGRLRDCNVIGLLSLDGLEHGFPRLLRILSRNRQLLFQREIQDGLLKRISGVFEIDNEPFDINTYSNLLANYLYNLNYINLDQREQLIVALVELLMNGIEHGNCRITHDEKTEWLESGKSIFELIRQKTREPEIRRRRVSLRYAFEPDGSTFRITDQGAGFDWRKRTVTAPGESVLNLHGRGITMARSYVENLRYNEGGNEVCFELSHQLHRSNVRPGPFAREEELRLEDGEIVFREGEASDFLYYIVSGRLGVTSNGETVSVLTPDDIFVGEMSFLLNSRRSATVTANGESSLLKISKQAFVGAIREHPHYGILLARLLAQRIDRLNRRVGAAKH